jgi:hypothetical protein
MDEAIARYDALQMQYAALRVLHHPVRLGLDYWNVISAHPGFCRWLAGEVLGRGEQVHVISAIGRNREGTIAGEVDALGVPYTAVHEVLFSKKIPTPQLKTELALKLGITWFFDDREDICAAMTAAGIRAWHVPAEGGERD